MHMEHSETIFYKFDSFLPLLQNALDNFKDLTHVNKWLAVPKEERNWTRSYHHPPEFMHDLKVNFKSLFNDELVNLIPEWKVI